MTKAQLDSEIQNGLIHLQSGDIDIDQARAALSKIAEEYSKPRPKSVKGLLHIIPSVHFYGRWKTIENKRSGFTFWDVVQQRECEVCGKVQTRQEVKG